MVYFKEEQKFDQWWIWGILIIGTIGILALFSYAFYLQLYLKVPWGDHPTSDLGLILTGLGSVIIMTVVNWGILSSKLELEIKNNAVYYKFFPFIWYWKTIKKEDMESYEVRKYKPLAEYGGWGYRWRFRSGKALTIKGNMGLQLQLKKGKKLLIGTQKAHRLKKVMNEMMTKRAENYG